MLTVPLPQTVMSRCARWSMDSAQNSGTYCVVRTHGGAEAHPCHVLVAGVAVVVHAEQELALLIEQAELGGHPQPACVQPRGKVRGR